MDKKERYLANPHVTITPELQSKLGITSQDLERRKRMLGGPAMELPDTEPEIRQEVIVRNKKGKRRGNRTTQIN